MATNLIYCDHGYASNVTNQFHIIYWIAPMIAAILIPVALNALYWQIPSEISTYGFTTKLKGIVIILCIGIVLSAHALTAYAIQWNRHFPILIASIQQIDNKTINIVSYKREEKRYDLPIEISVPHEPLTQSLAFSPHWIKS